MGKTMDLIWFATKAIAYAIGMGAWLVYAYLSWGWLRVEGQMAMSDGLGQYETFLRQFHGIIREVPILILATYTMLLVERAWHNVIGFFVLCIALLQHYAVTVFQGHDQIWRAYWYLVVGGEFITYGLIILVLRRLFRHDTSG